MLDRVRALLEMIRFSHTVFALPFALSSAALAWRSRPSSWSWPDFALELTGILVCMVFARSAAMAFNRLADRRYDAANPRTAGRHLPTGKLTVPAVRLFFGVCALAFVGSTALFLLTGVPNPWPLCLSVPVLAFVCAYSYTKRFTMLSHFWLGASLFLAPVAAWVAIRGLQDLAAPVVLGLAVLFWVAGFDILYACQDLEFDRRAKLSSVPARLGVKASLRVALGCHLVMVVLLLGLVWVARQYLGAVYLVGVAAVAAMLTYEHALVRPDDLTRVNQAFFHVNAVVSVGLFAVIVAQLAVGV
jgi:4-hydroxybenzoate polyprenyltransferase